MYGNLNENGPQRLRYLNTWPEVRETFWEGLISMVLLKEVCRSRWALGFPKATAVPSLLSSFCPLLVDEMYFLSYFPYTMPAYLLLCSLP